ncbi:TM2 domain-containing protein, partial [bacterium]|nr:TM2 domain-containing protein [bacterium]
MQNQAEQKEKSYIITLLLCLFFGCFGLHRFYTGYNKIGIMQLLLTISIIGVLASGMWALIDLILIIFNKYKTYNKETLVNDF